MNFWRFMIAFIVVSVFAQLSYLNNDFFQYELFFQNKFQWTSILKFIIEILLFALLFLGVYNLLEFLGKWRMERRYAKTQKEQEEEIN